MYYRTDLPASTTLQRAIRNGAFKSGVNEYLDSQIRRATGGWYAKALVGSGADEAERQLAEWAAERGLHQLADSVSAVATGMLELAQLDDRAQATPDDSIRGDKPGPQHVRVVSITREERSLPGYHPEGALLILATNPYVPGCGCSQPKGSYVFGRGGELGLQRIGLAVDRLTGKGELVLFLPHPEFRTADVQTTRLGAAMVGIDTKGSTHGSSLDYRFHADPVEYSLGLVDRNNAFSGGTAGGGVDVGLRFPGSHDYLIRHLPDLGDYLAATVAKLNGIHTH